MTQLPLPAKISGWPIQALFWLEWGCCGPNPSAVSLGAAENGYSSSPRRLLTRTIVSICSGLSRASRFRRTDSA
jgi:hypothetical protein